MTLIVPTLPLRSLIAASALLAMCGVASAQTCNDHGVPVNGFPSWRERATHVLTNACRIAPVPYRTTYLPSAPSILQPSFYPAVPPLQWSLGLNQAARAHSIDLATTPGCGFQHDSCNGTPWHVRIASYYPNHLGIAENVAAGVTDPLSAVNLLLLDNLAPSTPAPDGHPNDGHRRNIMSGYSTELGCGYASGPNTWIRFWTQDFARPRTTVAPCSPIAAGSHLIQSGAVSFLVNFYDAQNAAPQSATLKLGSTSVPITVHLGTAARGTYRATSPVATACRSYHFEFVDATGALRRYPARGELRTTGEGACTEEYIAGSICAADIDSSGAATAQDIFTFLAAWFGGTSQGNFNGTGGVGVQDIFDFLGAWFAGCA